MANTNTRIQGIAPSGTPGLQAIASGTQVIVTNKDLNQVMTQFVVSNLASAPAAGTVGDNLYIAGTDGQEAIPVFPQTAITIETDSPFKIIFPATKADGTASAASVKYVVAQLFYMGGRRAGGGAAPAAAPSGGGSASEGYVATNPRGNPGSYFHYQTP